MQRRYSTDVTQISFIWTQAAHCCVIAGGFNLKLFPSFWSFWHVTVQVLLYLTCKPTSKSNRSNSPPHSSINKPFPCSQFLKLIHLREVYPVKRWKKTYSSFHLSYCLFPCFSLPSPLSPPAFWVSSSLSTLFCGSFFIHLPHQFFFFFFFPR